MLHFSLGNILRSKQYGFKANIPLSVFFYAKGAEVGHVRSLSMLAHAFWEPESWLAEYSRLMKLGLIDESFSMSSMGFASFDDVMKILNSTLKHLGYNESERTIIVLPDGSDIIQLPLPLEQSCEIALPLLKYLAEHTYRIRDSARGGLESFMLGDTWAALDFFDEAADLGSASAQENAAYIYDLLAKSECESSPKSADESSTRSNSFMSTASIFAHEHFGVELPLATEYVQKDVKHEFNKKYLPNTNGSKCASYYNRMAAFRRLQLVANKDPFAMRHLADQLMVGTYPFAKNITAAAILYGAAADVGDVHSLMSLGWLFFTGVDGKITPNII